MSLTRRSWLSAMLASAVATVIGERRAPAAPARKGRKVRKGPRQGEPGYRTRWIGHY